MSLRVYIRSEAETDIEEAAIWYEKQRPGLGDEFLDELRSIFNTISETPAIYPVVHRGTRRALIRRFPFGVYFRIEDAQVIVFAIIHGSRHPRRWRQRR